MDNEPKINEVIDRYGYVPIDKINWDAIIICITKCQEGLMRKSKKDIDEPITSRFDILDL